MNIEKVDKDVEDYFGSLVKHEFQGHAGLALKYLCDIHKGICPNGHEELELKIDTLAVEIDKIQEYLNQDKTEDRKEGITSIGGNKIK